MKKGRTAGLVSGARSVRRKQSPAPELPGATGDVIQLQDDAAPTPEEQKSYEALTQACLEKAFGKDIFDAIVGLINSNEPPQQAIGNVAASIVDACVKQLGIDDGDIVLAALEEVVEELADAVESSGMAEVSDDAVQEAWSVGAQALVAATKGGGATPEEALGSAAELGIDPNAATQGMPQGVA